jgi:6-phosphogluconate dehydrogenase
MQMLSSLEEGRVALRKLFIRRPIYYVGKLDILIDQMKRALYAGMILTFAQGLDLLRVASGVYKYDLALGNVARIWRGSIIRSPLLQDICDTFSVQPRLPNLLSDSRFAHCLSARRDDLRDVVRLSVEQGIPAPALTASLVYYDAHRKLNPDDPQIVNRHPGSRPGGIPGPATRARGLQGNERQIDGRICT